MSERALAVTPWLFRGPAGGWYCKRTWWFVRSCFGRIFPESFGASLIRLRAYRNKPAECKGRWLWLQPGSARQECATTKAGILGRDYNREIILFDCVIQFCKKHRRLRSVLSATVPVRLYIVCEVRGEETPDEDS